MNATPFNGSSHIKAGRIIDCSFSLAVQEAEELIPLLEAPLQLQGDEFERGRPHEEIRFDWMMKSPLFSDFSGLLYFRLRPEKTYVCIEGSYTPPCGVLGKLFDRIVGCRLALGMAEDLLSRIAMILEKRYRRIRAW